MLKKTSETPKIPYIACKNSKYNRSDITEKDIFLECKDDGKFWYRKVIVNKKHSITDTNGKVYMGAKTSGSWLHEDTMAEKFINPHKKVVHIVKMYNGKIDYIEDTFIPEKGWTSNQ